MTFYVLLHDTDGMEVCLRVDQIVCMCRVKNAMRIRETEPLEWTSITTLQGNTYGVKELPSEIQTALGNAERASGGITLSRP